MVINTNIDYMQGYLDGQKNCMNVVKKILKASDMENISLGLVQDLVNLDNAVKSKEFENYLGNALFGTSELIERG